MALRRLWFSPRVCRRVLRRRGGTRSIDRWERRPINFPIVLISIGSNSVNIRISDRIAPDVDAPATKRSTIERCGPRGLPMPTTDADRKNGPKKSVIILILSAALSQPPNLINLHDRLAFS